MKPRRRSGHWRMILTLILCAFWIAGPATVRAQWPQHRLQSLFPPGGQAGQTVEVTLNGADLDTAEGLWFDHPGLSAEPVADKKATFSVTIAPETPVGLHDVRAVGPLGVSNPRTIVVGHRPEAVESEPNNGPEQTGAIALNQVVNGQINGATDIDMFAFDGKAGQRVLIELDAARIDSRLDGEVRLFGPDGGEIGYSHDGEDRDPMIDTDLPADGRYVIEVRDVVYAGSPDHVYRLTLHDGPHVDAIVPRAAMPGSEASYTLLGRNLGGEPADLMLADGRPLEQKTVTIKAPDDLSPDPNQAGTGFVASPAAGIRGFSYRFEDDSGVSEPVFIAEALAPVVVEREPNDGENAEAVQTVELPFDLSGDFRLLRDEDVYRFPAKKGQVWRIEVFAERIGSPVDASLIVQQVRDDGTVRDLADADDQNDPGTQNRFATGTVDPSLRWQVPEDGTYQVLVSDLYNAKRVAPKAVYRLVVRPEEPDFRLFVTPADPSKPEGVTIRSGGRATAYVLAWRSDGFDTPIRVEAEGLPDGVSSDPVVIGANEVQAPIVLTASPEAPKSVGTVRLVGRGLSEDRKEVLAALKDDAPEVGPEPVHQAVAGSITWPPPQNNVPAPARVTRGLVVAVRPEAPFRLSAEPDNVVVTQGEAFELTAKVERFEGFDSDVQVSAGDLPNRMGGANAKIDKGKDSASIKLTVPGNVEPGVYTILLNGAGKVSINADPEGKKKKDVTVNEPSNPITLTVKKK